MTPLQISNLLLGAQYIKTVPTEDISTDGYYKAEGSPLWHLAQHPKLLGEATHQYAKSTFGVSIDTFMYITLGGI